MLDRSRLTASPRNVALVYAIVSGAWILASDRIVAAAVDDPALLTSIQTVKGWLFITGSAALIYALVLHGQRDLARTNERLDRALQQSSVLHRVLRHNLRNSVNVIAGNAELLADRGGDVSPDDEEYLAVIRDQTDHLVAITRKTRVLRDLVFEDPSPTSVDLPAMLAERAAVARDRFPDATVETDLPTSLVVETDPRLSLAVDELVENAVVHNHAPNPTVRVELHSDGAGSATIEVVDDGPGIPEVERDVLEGGVERPMVHSEGLGLWIARTVADQVGGDVRIDANEPRGTVVRLVLP